MQPTPHHRLTRLSLGLLAAALLAAASPARADRLPMPPMPAYQTECAACHLAYPPGLLPAASWHRLMGQLPRHFGSDASLDAPTQAAIAAYLAANAGRFAKLAREPAPPPEDRISRARWFQREHRELPADVWQRQGVGSASNCAACHRDAASGDFGERSLKVPK